MRTGTAVIAYLATAAVFLAAAIINYHDPNPVRPILLAIASACLSGVALLAVRDARRRQR